MSTVNVLVMSQYSEGLNRVFEDYCSGIKANSGNYYYVDYIRQYLIEGKKRFEEKIEKVVLDRSIDYIFFIWWSCDLTFDLNFIERLAKSAIVVMNFFDTEYFFEGVDRYYAQLADLVILPDALSRHKYRQLNIEALTTFAMYDRNVYARNCNIEKSIDVSFVGNLRQSNRKEYIDYLRGHGIAVEAFGIGSDHGFVSFDAMMDVFNRSKINLNFTSTSNSGNYIVNPPAIGQRIRQSKGRPIEIALCGGFVLSEYAPGIEEMFVVEEEMEVFNTKEELLQKVQHYLSAEDKRTQIATKGYLRAISNYDVTAGFGYVFDKLEELKTRKSQVLYMDGEFLENFAAYRCFYILQFLLNGNWKSMWAELWIIVKSKRMNVKKCFHFSIKGFLHFMRGHPKWDGRLKRIKNWLNIQLKY